MIYLWDMGKILNFKTNSMDVDTILKEIEFSLNTMAYYKSNGYEKLRLQEEFYLKELIKKDHRNIFKNSKLIK